MRHGKEFFVPMLGIAYTYLPLGEHNCPLILYLVEYLHFGGSKAEDRRKEKVKG